MLQSKKLSAKVSSSRAMDDPAHSDLELNKVESLGSIQSLPSNVRSIEEVQALPEEYQSGDPKRPLKSRDEHGNVYTHSLNPLWPAVCFILLVEALERLSYYSINNTLNTFLTGQYDPTWNANMSTAEVNSIVSTATAITYTVPFAGAIVADTLLGQYWTILGFSGVFYLPGLLMIALSAYPELFSETFPKSMLMIGLLGFWAVGAGAIKGCVNVFGGQQFHPILQRAQIDQFYVRFYMAINIGSLIGGMVVPVIAEKNQFAAYLVPLVAFTVAIIIFACGHKHYVNRKPCKSANISSVAIFASSCCYGLFREKKQPVLEDSDIEDSDQPKGAVASCVSKIPKPSIAKQSQARGGRWSVSAVADAKSLFKVFISSMLCVPFAIAYSQLFTVFVTQSIVMKQVSFFSPGWMCNFDSFSVIITGFIAGTWLYPYFQRKAIHIPLTYKFAFGTSLGVLALISSLVIESQIHSTYNETGEAVNILWMILPYFLIGMGEVFTFSTGYEAAFLIAPPDQKALASAFNCFCIGGLPSYISAALFTACEKWAFTTPSGDTHLDKLPVYVEAHVSYYLWVLLGICIVGIIVNLLPPVRDYIENAVKESKERDLCK